MVGFEKKEGKGVAKLWKNGKATELSDGKKSAGARSVFISNGDVYVAGSEDKEGKTSHALEER